MATMTTAGDSLVMPVAKEQRKRRKKKNKSVLEATENSENSPQNGMTKEDFATDDPEAVDVDAADKISKSKARKLRRQRQKQRYVNASETKTNRSENAQPTSKVDLQPERKIAAKSSTSAVDSIVEIVENATLQEAIHENRRDHSSIQISAIGDMAVSETNSQPESTAILGNVPFEREAASGTTAVHEISPLKEIFTPSVQRKTDDVASDIVDKVIAVDYQPATEAPSSTATQNASQIVVEEEARDVVTARRGVFDAYKDDQETAKEDCSCAACTMM